MLRETVLVVTALLAVAVATQVNKCGNGGRNENDNEVLISGCEKPPCILKRKTSVDIVMKFVAPRDISSLKTTVTAVVLGIELPFIGVDGTSACNNVYNLDKTKAPCPLKAGTEYVYSRRLDVLNVYPKLTTVVHWALTDGDDNIACFEVPAKIT